MGFDREAVSYVGGGVKALLKIPIIKGRGPRIRLLTTSFALKFERSFFDVIQELFLSTVVDDSGRKL